MIRPRASIALLMLVFVLSAAACSGGASAEDIVISEATRAPAAAGSAAGGAAAVAALGADLYRVLGHDGANEGNLVFSPYSAAIALAMTRAGAAGLTADEMDAVLHADLAGDLDAAFNALEAALAGRPGSYPLGDTTVALELATANALWAQAGFAFEPAFLDRLAADYGSGVHLVDYIKARAQARRAINGWVDEQTAGRIPELIPEGVLNELTRLVLTNAIYLKAPWQHPFEDSATAPAPFHRLDGSVVDAPLMHVSSGLFYARGDGYEAVELPYVGDTLAMLVIVPDAGTFDAFESRLDGAAIPAVVDALGATHVDLALPRFEFRTQAMLRPALAALGMPTAFTDEADFSAMSTAERLVIQEVVHEAFIAVDEAGTEAAAATAVIVGVTSAPVESVMLTVDRPFLFVIRDRETGAVLFMGRVVDPTE